MKDGSTFTTALRDNLGYVVSLYKLVWFEPLEFDLRVAVLILSLNFFLSLQSDCKSSLWYQDCPQTPGQMFGKYLICPKCKVSSCSISSRLSLRFLTNLIMVNLDPPSMISSGFQFSLKINETLFFWFSPMWNECPYISLDILAAWLLSGSSSLSCDVGS